MRTTFVGIITYLSLSLTPAVESAEAIPKAATTLTTDGGSASFAVGTNAIGINVKGKSHALRVNVEMHNAADGVVLDHISAWLPVKTLVTGMSLRDEHMRKYVFDKPNGETEDLRFEAQTISCAGLAAGREVACPVSGMLAIRGIPRQFSTTFKIRQESAGFFRIRGAGTVKLSDYGIDPPSQLGVKTANEVQVQLEFTATPALSASISGVPQR